MPLLQSIKPALNNIIHMIADTIDTDIAIIDNNYNLIASTDNYVKQKGTEVHRASVNKIIEMGRTVITDPGHNKTCTGCRFINNCPSSLEIIKSIQIDDKSVGIISLSTSKNNDCNTSRQSNERIEETLDKITDLIKSILSMEAEKKNEHRQQLSITGQKTTQPLENIIGTSPIIKALKEKLKKISKSNATVLLTGETGTGKEIFAKTIHSLQNKESSPFIEVNCASIPESLFESELFGYEGQSFTGAARHGKTGFIEMAHGGTLFLDEISELPLHLQPKLLRVLQEKSFFKVGGQKKIFSDTRIIAASNRNLKEMSKKGTFREDLYYRLHIIPLHIPRLRNRKEDIPLLVKHFTQKIHVHDQVMQNLTSHDWPGNVRELENTLEYMTVMGDGKTITPDDFPDHMSRPFSDPKRNLSLRERTALFETGEIASTISKFGNDLNGKTLAAKELKIGLRTLYRKMGIQNQCF